MTSEDLILRYFYGTFSILLTTWQNDRIPLMLVLWIPYKTAVKHSSAINRFFPILEQTKINPITTSWKHELLINTPFSRIQRKYTWIMSCLQFLNVLLKSATSTNWGLNSWNSRWLCIEWQKVTNMTALHHFGINLTIVPLTRDSWSASGKVTTCRFGEMVPLVLWKWMEEACTYTAA